MFTDSLLKDLRNAVPLAEDYKEITIPKKGGGLRKISIPNPELMNIQKKILRFLNGSMTEKDWLVKKGRHDFISFSMIKVYYYSFPAHAWLHADSRFIFQFDIKDAFPSVNSQMVHETVRDLLKSSSLGNAEKEELADLITALTVYKGVLPQGAPTSPILFFLLVIRGGLFETLSCLLQNESYRWHRWLQPNLPGKSQWKISFYFDNFVISGDQPLPDDLKEMIFKNVRDFGFKINEKKTWQADCREGVPLVTGLRVDGIKKRVSLPKRTIRKWRAIIHKATSNPTPESRLMIEGFIASTRPIYRGKLPMQILKPLILFRQACPPPEQKPIKKSNKTKRLILVPKKIIQTRLIS